MIKPCVALLVVFFTWFGSLQAEGGAKIRTFSLHCPRANASRYFLITATGGSVSFAARGKIFTSEQRLECDLAAMRHVARNWAVGVGPALSYQGDSDREFMLSIKPRARYWLSERLHCDLTIGAVVARFREDSYSSLSLPLFNQSLAIGLSDWISLSIQHEYAHFRYKPSGPDFSENFWYVTLQVGAYPGAILMAPAIWFADYMRRIND